MKTLRSQDRQLCHAVAAHDLRGLHAALTAGASSDARAVEESEVWLSSTSALMTEGWTALTYASWLGHTDIIKMLIATGADIEASTEYGWRPLMMAAANGKTQAVRLLLTAGAVLDAVGDHDTAMTWAAAQGHIETLRFLLEQGANPNGPDYPEMSRAIWTAVSYHRPKVIRLLAEHGADLDVRDSDGETALERASLSGRKQTAAALLAAGASDSLHAAARRGDLRALQTLLKRGADPNGPEFPEMSRAFQTAIWDDRPQVIQLLAKHGADLDVHDKFGNTALALASEQGKTQAAAALLKAGATDTLHDAAARGDMKALERLLDAKAIKSTNLHGRTPLHCAARNGQARAVKRLLAEPGISLKAAAFKGVLSEAASSGSKATVALLVKKGCKATELNNRPLVKAVASGCADAVRTLLSHGADPNTVDDNGYPVLYDAVHAHNHAVTRALLEHGADVRRAGPDDCTLLDVLHCEGEDSKLEALLNQFGL